MDGWRLLTSSRATRIPLDQYPWIGIRDTSGVSIAVEDSHIGLTWMATWDFRVPSSSHTDMTGSNSALDADEDLVGAQALTSGAWPVPHDARGII